MSDDTDDTTDDTDADRGTDSQRPEPGDGPPEPAADAGRVLSPGELDIADDEAVEELEAGRFVVSTGGGPPSVPDDGSPSWQGDHPEGERSDGPEGRPAGSTEAARNRLDAELARTRGRYAVDVVARFDGEPATHRTVSNDVVATFENLVVWYARHVSDGTPVDEVLAILIREASVLPEPEGADLAELLAANDLDPEDSIAALVEAIAEEAGRD
jgi:hypothetical protein